MARKPAFAWIGPVSGMLFVVLLVAAFALGSGANADPEGSAMKIADELEEAQDGASAFLGLLVLSVFFFLFFLAYLRDRLGASGTREHGSSRCSGAPGCYSRRCASWSVPSRRPSSS